MPSSFDPYHKWLGISPSEQPPNYYRLLGLALFEDDPEVIAHGADRQMAHVRIFQAGPHSFDSQRILNELAAAKVCLLRASKKAEYDRELQAALQEKNAPTPHRSQSTTPPEIAPAPPVAEASKPELLSTGDFSSKLREYLGPLWAELVQLQTSLKWSALVVLVLFVVVLAMAMFSPAGRSTPVADAGTAPAEPEVKPAIATPAPKLSAAAERAKILNEPPPKLEPGGGYALRLRENERIELPGGFHFGDGSEAFTADLLLRLDTSQRFITIFGNQTGGRDAQPGWIAAYGAYVSSGSLYLRYGLRGSGQNSDPLPTGWSHIRITWSANVLTATLNGGPAVSYHVLPQAERYPMLFGLCIGQPRNRFINGVSSFDVRAFRMSKGVRGPEPEQPPLKFTSDEQTYVLLDFSEGTGERLTDLSGHGNHANIFGGKWIAVPAADLQTPPAK